MVVLFADDGYAVCFVPARTPAVGLPVVNAANRARKQTERRRC